MLLREFYIHIKRDFDTIIRAKNKHNILFYVLLRQFYRKLLRKNEENIIPLVKSNILQIYGKSFKTRAKTLDFLFFSKYYEEETTKYILSNKGNIFIDIGSHIGRFPIISSNNFKKIIAIEPHPQNYSQLKENVSLNKCKNITIINRAISNRSGVAYMSDLNSNTGSESIKDNGKNLIKKVSLNELIEDQKLNISDISLILIDVENHENEVLEGSNEILKKGNAKLIIESFNVSEIESKLKKYGYQKVLTLDFYNHLFIKNKNFNKEI